MATTTIQDTARGFQPANPGRPEAAAALRPAQAGNLPANAQQQLDQATRFPSVREVFAQPLVRKSLPGITLVLVLLLLGVYRVLRGRALAGYRSMQQAVLISLLIAQPFEFWDAQLAALPSLVASLVSFGALRYMIQQEEERAASATVAAQT